MLSYAPQLSLWEGISWERWGRLSWERWLVCFFVLLWVMVMARPQRPHLLSVELTTCVSAAHELSLLLSGMWILCSLIRHCYCFCLFTCFFWGPLLTLGGCEGDELWEGRARHPGSVAFFSVWQSGLLIHSCRSSVFSLYPEVSALITGFRHSVC